MTWKDYETLLAMRGDRAGVRMIDIAWFARFLEQPTQSQTVRALRAALR